MENRKPPRLSSLKGKPTSWGVRLDQFRVQSGLSIRDLTGVCDHRFGKTTMHRICRGLEDQRLERLAKPIIAESLRTFLRGKAKSELEIEREMCAIFNQQDYKEDIKPVLTQRATLPKAAQSFFGLACDPFTTDPRSQSEVFTTPELDRLLARFIEAIKYQGFLCATGHVGSGKTILKRRVVDECLKSKGKLHLLWPEFMNMEKVHSGSIASFILRKFNHPAPHDLVHRADKLKSLLSSMADEGTRVALGFDECHRLHPNLLTALKNFWELGSGGFDRYLGLVLFGQPHFEDTLRQAAFREILERLDIVRVQGLGKNATGYLAHRLKIAGGKLDALIEPAVVARLVKVADTPLALGNVVNAALLKAYEVGSKSITAETWSLMNVAEKGEPTVRAARPTRQ